MAKRVDPVLLQAAANNWTRQLMVDNPVIGLAAYAIDDGHGHLLVEVPITHTGPQEPRLVLDLLDREKQTILWPPLDAEEPPMPRGRPRKDQAEARKAQAEARAQALAGLDISDCDPTSRRSTRRLRSGPKASRAG